MAAIMIGAEVSTASAFMGVSLKSEVAPSKARVSMMAYNRQDLERKPLSLLRILARQAGVRGLSKQELVNGLLGVSPSYSTSYQSTSYYHSAPSFSAPAASDDENALTAMSLGELRALAKERGLRGDTKAEIIKLLLKSGGLATSTSAPYTASAGSAPTSAPAAAASPALPIAVLERKSLSELRAMARIRGVRGDTKAELVKLLGAPAPAASSNGSANGAASSNGSYKSAPAPGFAARQLATKSLSQLRAIAAIKGIRGTTKDELVKQLALLA